MNSFQPYLIAQADAAPADVQTQAIVEAQAPAGAQPATPARQGSPFGSMWILIPLFGLMYFLMIRPQRKRQKEMQAMQDTLKVGDKVMTANGSYGTVSKVGDRTVWVNYSGKLDVEYVRNAIVDVITEKAPAEGETSTK